MDKMRKRKKAYIGFRSILLILFSSLMVISTGCSTAGRMADQTYLNADKNVWSYEEFHKEYEAYKQYKTMVDDLKAELEAENAKGEKKDTEQVKNLNQRISGAKDMKRNIASRYNAMSSIHYQAIWKSNNLPEKLEE